MPSLYEGFPLVLVEAQTSGLLCVVSDRIPAECDITGNICFLRLEDDDNEWLDALKACRDYNQTYAQKVREKGFDIGDAAHELQEYYFDLLKEKY